MSVSQEQAIKAITCQINEIEQIESNEDYSSWEKNTLLFLSRIYGRESFQFKELDRIDFKSISFGGTDYSQDFVEHSMNASLFLKGLLQELNIFGLPDQTGKIRNIQNQVNIHQQQEQSQTLNLELVIKQALEELPTEMIEQIRQIIKEGGSKETILKKIGNKLSELGTGVLSSSLATILMNYWNTI